MRRPDHRFLPGTGAVGTERLMRAPAWTGGATAFVTAALADELPLIVAESREEFGSASAAGGSKRAPRASAEDAKRGYPSTDARAPSAPSRSTVVPSAAPRSTLPVLPST